MEIFEFVEIIERLKREKHETSVRLSAIDAAIESLLILSGDVSDIKVHQMSAPSISVNQTTVSKRTAYDSAEIEIPQQFSSELSILEMLIYALSIRPFTAVDAAEYICSLDDGLNPDMMKRRFTDIASALGRADKLNSKKIGKKYRYSLKQEDVEQKKVA